MEVLIDGIIYTLQSRGGISRIFNEILPRMCSLDDLLNISLLTQGDLKQNIPTHPQIIHYPVPYLFNNIKKGSFWEPITNSLRTIHFTNCAGNQKEKIWHTTYYRMPKRWKGPIIVTVFDMIYEHFSELFGGADGDRFRDERRRCIQNADAIICISKTTMDDIKRFYGIDNRFLKVIQLGCSDIFKKLNKTEMKSKTENDKPFFLYVGTRPHYKNFNGLVQAYKAWSGKKNVDLVFVGNPWSVREKKFLDQLGMMDQIKLLINVDDESLCRLYNKAASFVYPSLYEGFGVPLLEAMACGCPIIASNIPATIEIAGECPIYFKPTEQEDLIKAFDNVLSEGKESNRVKAGLERFKSFSWDKTASKTLGVYKSLLS